MYTGRVVEEADVRTLFHAPKHPYTQGLLRSIPKPYAESGEERHARLPTIEGTVPDLLELPEGCTFRPRCPQAFEKCTQVPPEFLTTPACRARCWLHEGPVWTPEHRAAGEPVAGAGR
jgi:oligopeptide/dipeptide ABC transporter ATP-binding protein